MKTLAQDLARTQFKFHKVIAKDEIEPIRTHQALETISKYQPTKKGKSMLTCMDLKKLIEHRLARNQLDETTANHPAPFEAASDSLQLVVSGTSTDASKNVIPNAAGKAAA